MHMATQWLLLALLLGAMRETASHAVTVFVDETEFHMACKHVDYAVHRLDTRETSPRRPDNVSLVWDRFSLFLKKELPLMHGCGLAVLQRRCLQV